MDSPDSPANDAQRAQNARSALGRSGYSSGLNVSSCGFVVTLHGVVREAAERRGVEEVVRRVEGVRGVLNRLKVAGVREVCFSALEDG